MFEKIEVPGIIVLAIGVALLIFTFVNAYLFLREEIGALAAEDLVEAPGEAVAPLIAACVRIMYLVVMGWIASILTVRGIALTRQPLKPETAREAKAKTKSTTKEPTELIKSRNREGR